MAINFSKAFGIHEHALKIRSDRAVVLANNLSNADTPGYKAQDFSFADAIKSVNTSGRLNRTHHRHVDSESEKILSTRLQYRVPMQADTGDGNTVDSQAEMTRFSENALSYQTSLRFLNGKIRSVMSALKGE